MQKIVIIILLLLGGMGNSIAQDCTRYQTLMQEGDQAFQRYAYYEALRKYQAAAVAASECGISSARTDLKIQTLVSEIDKKRERAEKAERRAQRAERRAFRKQTEAEDATREASIQLSRNYITQGVEFVTKNEIYKGLSFFKKAKELSVINEDIATEAITDKLIQSWIGAISIPSSYKKYDLDRFFPSNNNDPPLVWEKNNQLSFYQNGQSIKIPNPCKGQIFGYKGANNSIFEIGSDTIHYWQLSTSPHKLISIPYPINDLGFFEAEPNGNYVILLDRSLQKVSLYDVQQQKAHTFFLPTVSFSFVFAEKRAYFGQQDGILTVFDLEKEESVQQQLFPATITTMFLSRDGEKMLLTTENNFKLLKTNTLETSFEMNIQQAVTGVGGFTFDSKYFYIGDIAGNILLYECESLVKLHQQNTYELGILSVTPTDHSYEAYLTFVDNSIRKVNLLTGEFYSESFHTGLNKPRVFLAEKNIGCFENDPASRKPVELIDLYFPNYHVSKENNSYQCVFLPKRRNFITAIENRGLVILPIKHIEKSAPERVVDPTLGFPTEIVYSNDEHIAAVLTLSNQIHFYDLGANRKMNTLELPRYVSSFGFINEGRGILYVLDDGTIGYYDPQSAQVNTRKSEAGVDFRVIKMISNQNGDRIAALMYNSAVECFASDMSQQVFYQDAGGRARLDSYNKNNQIRDYNAAVGKFSKNGLYFIAGNIEGTLNVYNIAHKDSLLLRHEFRSHITTLEDNGNSSAIYIALSNGKIYKYNLASGLDYIFEISLNTLATQMVLDEENSLLYVATSNGGIYTFDTRYGYQFGPPFNFKHQMNILTHDPSNNELYVFNKQQGVFKCEAFQEGVNLTDDLLGIDSENASQLNLPIEQKIDAFKKVDRKERIHAVTKLNNSIGKSAVSDKVVLSGHWEGYLEEESSYWYYTLVLKPGKNPNQYSGVFKWYKLQNKEESIEGKPVQGEEFVEVSFNPTLHYLSLKAISVTGHIGNGNTYLTHVNKEGDQFLNAVYTSQGRQWGIWRGWKVDK